MNRKTKKKIGFYGGSFDPIHFGHLNLAIQLFEAHGLDEVWFCPAALSPHKGIAPPALPKHRLEMLRLAIADIPQFHPIDIEIKKPPPSYTVDTLRLVKESFENWEESDFFIFLGEDAARGFSSWKEPAEIIKLATPLVGLRSQEAEALSFESAEITKKLQEGFTITKKFDISSTEIRRRIRAKQYIGHLVPSKVLDYIYTHQLYF